MKYHIDFETRSAVNLNEVGAFAYARHPSTEINCMGIRREDQKKTTVFKREYFLGGWKSDPVLFTGTPVLVAHNAHFEYAIWKYILKQRYGFINLDDPKYWDCTMARTAACNLPMSLENAGHALNTDVKKYAAGRAVMFKLCKPVGFDALGDPIYNEDPELFNQLYQYNETDVDSEYELDKILPPLPPQEKKIWDLDLLINDRGVEADVDSAKGAKFLAEHITNDLNAKLFALTKGKVDKASRVKAMTDYVRAQGVQIESLTKESVSNLLADPKVPQHIKDVVKIRAQVGKSSTAKYETIINVADTDDSRMRGLLQYHGAGTGRWAGRLVQPQNFPKGIGFDSDEVVGQLTLDVERFKLFYGDKSMDALSAALRGMFIAGEGKEFIVADYSAIEARVVAWLAHEEIVLAKYRMGVNMYEDMAWYIYGRKIDKKKDPKEYAVGKAVILGCGYGMGVDKFIGTCQTNGVDIDPALAEKAVKAFRGKYKGVVSFWYATERAAINAVTNPGSVHAVGKITWTMSKDRRFLGCRLPSGRYLRYYRPSVKQIMTKWGEEKPTLHYWAADSKKGDNFNLAEFKTYGGSLVENVTQATARDIMAAGMLNAEGKGMPVVLTVHDEVIVEPEEERFEVRDLEKALCGLPQWATGCPVNAEGWKGKRYKKG